MLERFFGGCDGGFFGMGWWIIVVFFLFLAFLYGMTEIHILFLILLLIVCGSMSIEDDECGCC